MRNSTPGYTTPQAIFANCNLFFEKNVFRFFLPVLLMVFASQATIGQTAFTATYTFGSTGNVASFDYNGTVYPGIAPTAIIKNTVVTSSSSNNFRATDWPTGATNGSDVFSGSVDLTRYIQFAIAPVAGYKFTVTSINFGVGRSATGPRQWEWRGSADTYGAPLTNYTTLASGLVNASGILTHPDANSSWTGNVLTLSTGYTDLTSTATFRLYGFNSEAAGGTAGLQGAITITGTYAAAVTNYSVTYNGNTNTSGTAPTDPSSPYASGSNVTVLGAGTLAKTGYTFSGWNTVANGSGTAYAAGGTISNLSANTTLYAQWTINTYPVTYDGNTSDGGSAPVDPSSPYNYNSNVTVLGAGTLTKTGYTFVNWNTASDGSGTPYSPGGTITGITTGITLYAQWILANTYAVTYAGNGFTGGTPPEDPNSPYTGGSDVTVLSAGSLVKTGYTFSGWNTAPDGSGTPYSPGNTISSIGATITLYAQWTINTYSVTYDGNTNDGGSAPVDPSSPYDYNSNVTVLGVGSLTKTNYNFTGWNTAANGSGTTYAAGATITGISTNVTLYAQWAIQTFTVIYNGNGSTGGAAPVDPSSPYDAGSNVTILGAGSLVKTGYSFAGWNTASDGSGTAYAAAATLSNILANTTLFAQWTLNTYTVTYNGNGNTGGTVPVDPNSPYDFGSTVTVLANTGSLVKTGADFVGWNTAADGTGTNYDASGSASFTLGASNVVLYAKWAEPLYEGFNYTVGTTIGGTTNGSSNNNWTVHSGTGSNTISAGSLSYSGLQTSTGNKVTIGSPTTADVNTAVSLPGGSVAYFSMLVNVADATSLGAGDYFAGFGATSGTSVTSLFGRLFIKSSGSGFQLGVTNNSGTGTSTTYYATDLSFGTTYLVVVKHDFNGASNDITSLWVNPSSLGGTEPVADATNSGSGSTVTGFASIFLRNGSGTPHADIDEIRVGSTWAQVTPTSGYTITATAIGDGSISPAGSVLVNGGSDQPFTITANSCNDIADVIVDGTTSVLGDMVGNTYTFTNVSADHTIDVYFNPSTSTTWTGAVNNDWDNAGNWTSCVPNETLDVTIPASASLFPIMNVDASVNSLTIEDGAALVLGGHTLTINGGYTGTTAATIVGSSASNLVLNSTVTLASANTITLHNLDVNGGTVTLTSPVDISGGDNSNGPGTVTVQGGSLLESNGFLTIKSNAFGTARVAAGDDGGNYISGDVTVERYIPNNGFRSWRLLSVPTSGGQTIRNAWQEGVANPAPLQNNLGGLGTQITSVGNLAAAQAAGFDNVSASASMLSWNGSGWSAVSSTNQAIDNQSAYFLFVRGDRSKGITGAVTNTNATTLRSTGALYQGTQAIPSFAANSFNLVGNLYPSAIDFTQLNRTGGVSNLFYIWDSKKQSGNSLGAYQTFSATNGFQCLVSGGSYTVGQPNTTIESGQGFFVLTSGTPGSITLTESSKIDGGANLGFRPADPASLVKIDSRLYAAGSTNIADANVVVFNDAYTNDVAEEDALKLANNNENFAIQNGTKTTVIEGRKTIQAGDAIVFNMWNLQQQSYKLEFVPQNLDNTALVATLEDSYLQTSTPISLTGASTINFTVDANAGSKAANRFSIHFRPANPLPVSFTSVAANRMATGVKVDWKVATEINLASYEIQSSADGRNFSSVGTVTANNSSSYSFTDAAAGNSVIYYRIKSVGTAGDFKFTAIVKVAAGNGQPAFTISPNPVEGSVINLQFSNQPKGNYLVKVISNLGQEMMSAKIAHAGGSATQLVNLPSNFVPGMYQVEIIAADKSVTTQQLLVK